MASRRHIRIKSDLVNDAVRNAELVTDMFDGSHHLYLEDDYVLIFILCPYGHVWVNIGYNADKLCVKYPKTDEEYFESEDHSVYNVMEYANAKDMYIALVNYFSDKKNAARV
ncbi:hypothetical protein HWD15_gp01 [Bifidobacterium phage BadAargau2]|uniref:Uncharacterized protein n=1 Tax=Bifidobacterium phage BadAargau2 TaxID=2713242 RepID=A0A6G6Y148_9CAUD|nr:hypothetical protein HWD15_gp01 [Bifidobacterium phage BadAargau2]QIG78296.1 hypothetical protein BAAR0010003c01_00001 [Bifidobacterium phage BadAargau2]